MGAMATSPKTGDMELGGKIAARRDELGMSRKQLAEATNLSYPYIAQIETGYRLPSTKHQVILAKVLGMSLDELFGTEEDLPQAPVRATAAASAPNRRHRSTIDEAIEHAAQEIEALPTSVRLEALSRIQLRIMSTVAEDQSRQR
jgi:transcriptional regulator with XRE-family HTH domain